MSVAFDWLTPRATPMAAETPMAGAPRTIMSRMTVATWLVVGGEDVGLLERELGLVEEVNAVREPF